MLKQIKKISKDVKAFTLTEVMIGMMILTVAIVSASNLLSGIIDSNRNNLTTLQAYYLSQEGLEMVRNIRDTNWLHNMDWLGKNSMNVWGGELKVGKNIVSMVDAAGIKSSVEKDDPFSPTTILKVGSQSPWTIGSGVDKIYRHGMLNVDRPYLDSISNSAEDSGFKRTIIVSEYDCKYLVDKGVPCPSSSEKKSYVLVQSKVEWTIGAKKRDLVLSQVLSNWKGGAL